ncbi:MAG: hypothetical protein OEZ51_13895 [Nitrospinota bacterium]|nr:hypothetical protein [Nitrospinota bacterium]
MAKNDFRYVSRNGFAPFLPKVFYLNKANRLIFKNNLESPSRINKIPEIITTNKYDLKTLFFAILKKYENPKVEIERAMVCNVTGKEISSALPTSPRNKPRKKHSFNNVKTKYFIFLSPPLSGCCQVITIADQLKSLLAHTTS